MIINFLLIYDICLFLKEINNELTQKLVHFFNFLIKLVFDVELFFRIFWTNDSNSHVFRYVFNANFLLMTEWMKHLWLRETYLPFVLENQFSIDHSVFFVFSEEKFTVSRLEVIISSFLFIFLIYFFEKIFIEKFSFLPFSDQLSQLTFNRSRLIISLLRLFMNRILILENSAEVTIAIHALFIG